MPISETNFVSNNASGFVSALDACVLSGTAAPNSSSAGVTGLEVAASASASLCFTLPGVGIVPIELYPPYEQYNTPSSLPLNISEITVYYTVAGAALGSIAIALYATVYPGASVTTILASGANGLSTAEGTFATTIDLGGINIPMPNSLVFAELAITTEEGGTCVVNGVAFS